MSDNPHCRCEWYWWSPEREQWYNTNGAWRVDPFTCGFCGTQCGPGARTYGPIAQGLLTVKNALVKAMGGGL